MSSEATQLSLDVPGAAGLSSLRFWQASLTTEDKQPVNNRQVVAFRGAPTEPSSPCGRKIINKYEQSAAVSLARVLSEEGRRSGARDIPVPVDGWFTEGFDAPDLKDPKALLEALMRSRLRFRPTTSFAVNVRNWQIPLKM
jgi:hypothetical protein